MLAQWCTNLPNSRSHPKILRHQKIRGIKFCTQNPQIFCATPHKLAAKVISHPGFVHLCMPSAWSASLPHFITFCTLHSPEASITPLTVSETKLSVYRNHACLSKHEQVTAYMSYTAHSLSLQNLMTLLHVSYTLQFTIRMNIITNWMLYAYCD